MITETAQKTPITILITGGTGFLGLALVAELLEENSPIQPKEIRVFDLNPMPNETSEMVSFIQGDVQNVEELITACKGVDLVIHSAAIIDWGTKEESEVLSVNVGGTKNVIKACRENNIKNLIFTSSLDAVYTGKPLVNIDESQPYATSFATSYCKSKALGEQAVLAANGPDLKTCALRPSDIYGERDPYHLPPILNMAKSGFYIRLGNGESKCQHIYVGNMAHAHVLAAQDLMTENPRVAGQAYFLTDGPGSNFFSFFDDIVLKSGYKITPKNLWLPKWLAYPMASISEFGGWLISPIKKVNVKFSRFAVNYTCTDFTFNSEKAKRDFNFVPKYSVEEAIERTAYYFEKHQAL